MSLSNIFDKALRPINTLYVILIASFGPYVIADYGIRLEHIAIYTVLGCAFLTNISNIKDNISQYRDIYTLILLLIFIPIIGLFLSEYSVNYMKVLSQFENYMQPFAIVSISLLVLNSMDYERLLNAFHSVLKLFIVLMAMHTIVSVLIISFPGFWLWKTFTGNQVAQIIIESGAIPLIEISTKVYNASELARLGGRVSGVFTQIFEAGYAYSLALISFAYLAKREDIKFKYLLLLSILIGGILTYSKVFLIIGLISYILLLNKNQMKRYLVFSIGVLCFVYLILGSFSINDSVNNIYIDRLFDVNHFTFSGIIQIFTSGRFSADSTIFSAFSGVLSNAPIFGYGYGYTGGSDLALVEVVILGGICGLLTYLCLFFLFFYNVFKVNDLAILKYYLALVVITALTSIAAPTITANRISVIFWILTTILVLINSKQPQYKAH